MSNAGEMDVLAEAEQRVAHIRAAQEARATRAADPAAYATTIRELHADGASITILGRATGVTRQAIWNLVHS